MIACKIRALIMAAYICYQWKRYNRINGDTEKYIWTDKLKCPYSDHSTNYTSLSVSQAGTMYIQTLILSVIDQSE